MDPSNSRGDAKDIFLSHAGEQKNFVEHLFYALQRANRTAFLDKHSLPSASPFPDGIKRALHNCKLGVLLLSHKFFSKKWPMLELEILMLEEKCVLPLFYELVPEDLCSDENISEWREKWEGMVGHEQVQQWRKAVKKLRSIHGVIFKSQESEFDYINRVVNIICKLVPSHLPYDLSEIQGHKDLVKEIIRHFHELGDDARPKETRIVGLHGVGGLGKTTVCMSMVNFYESLYFGRSSLIEFPTDGDKLEILRVCQTALRKLGSLDDNALKDIERFEQVVRLMKEYVRAHNVFLAIDNVWPHTEEMAKALLGVGFSAASKVVLTSRSEQVLQNLLAGRPNNSYIGPLPGPKRKYALRIFQNSLNQGDLTSVAAQNEIFDKVLKRCKFNGSYHPIALTALGLHVRHLVAEGQDWSAILGKIDDHALETLDDTVKLNYNDLPLHLKHMFLDISVCIPRQVLHFRKRTYANVLRWLRLFYNEYTENQIIQCIRKLALAGVIQIKVNEDGKKMIVVHDLYLDLAQKEASRSPRFLASIEQAVEARDWSNLERVVILEKGKRYQFRGHKYSPKLQLLCAANVEIQSRIDLKLMPSLRVLLLFGLKYEKAISPSWKDLHPSRKINLKGLPKLEFLWLEDCNFIEKFDGLDSLQNLQMLFVAECRCLKSLSGLRRLTQLEVLKIRNCEALKEVPNLDGMTGLERLILDGNCSLEEVGSLSPAIKVLRIENCWALKKTPQLRGVTSLERLILSGNGSLKEVGCLSPALKEVSIANCWALKQMPDMGGLTGLERLALYCNRSLEEVGWLSPALKEVHVRRCDLLKKLVGFGHGTGLERLMLVSNGSLEEVGCLRSALREVVVEDCGALKKMQGDRGGLTGLESLALISNPSLEEVGCFGPALKKVIIMRCTALKKLPEVGGLPNLESFMLIDNEALEEVGCLGPAVKELTVVRCGALKKLPDLDGLTGLERLTLSGNELLDDVRCVNPALKRLLIEKCSRLRRLNVLELRGNNWTDEQWRTRFVRFSVITRTYFLGTYGKMDCLQQLRIEECGTIHVMRMGGLTNLRCLEVRKCEELEEIVGLCALRMLEEVTLHECERLEDRCGDVRTLSRRGNLKLDIDQCPGLLRRH